MFMSASSFMHSNSDSSTPIATNNNSYFATTPTSSTSSTTASTSSSLNFNPQTPSSQVFVNIDSSSLAVMVEIDSSKGPRIVNPDGRTYSYCANWNTIEEAKQEKHLQMIARANLQRRDACYRNQEQHRNEASERRETLKSCRRRLQF